MKKNLDNLRKSVQFNLN